MNIKEIKDSIWEKLHDKIQQQKPEVRDKKYFILQNVLSMTSGAFFVLLILFCFSLMFFFISHNNLLLFSQFGLRGWQSLFLAFPWWLLIVALALIFLLEVLFKKYQIIYRRPLVYSLIIFLIFAFAFGSIIARMSWHDDLLEQARGRHLPVLGGMYRNFEEPANLHVGQLKEQTETIWAIQSRTGEIQFVVISPKTKFPQGNIFALDDLLLVAGPSDDGQIEAWGVMPFQPRQFDRGFGKLRPMMK